MIEEDYVSYEIARLLNEKGFDESCFACYEYFISGVTMYSGWMFEYKGNPVRNTDERIKCPTVQMAMKWLREKGMDCVVIPYWDTSKQYRSYVLTDLGDKYKDYGDSISDNISYKQAAEAAIKYCLKNLIL